MKFAHFFAKSEGNVFLKIVFLNTPQDFLLVSLGMVEWLIGLKSKNDKNDSLIAEQRLLIHNKNCFSQSV